MAFYTKPIIIGLPVQPVAPSHRIGPSHPPPTSKRSPSPVQPDPARHSVRPCRAPPQPPQTPSKPQQSGTRHALHAPQVPEQEPGQRVQASVTPATHERPPAARGTRGSLPPLPSSTNQTRQAERTTVPSTAPTPQAPQNWQTSKCKTTSITGLPTAPNHNSQGPDVLSALHIHSVPRYSAWLDLAPFPAHSKPISNEFPRSQFKNTRGRLLAPMKFNSTSHSLC
jgi:hypothetical protein